MENDGESVLSIWRCGLDGCVYFFDSVDGMGTCANPESACFRRELKADNPAPYYMEEEMDVDGETVYALVLACFAGVEDIDPDA